MNYIQWAMLELSGLPDDENAKAYKQKVLSRMNERASEIASMGVSDEKILNELIISEFKNIKQEYYSTVPEKKKSKNKGRSAKLSAVGVIGYIMALILVFLGISFISGAWSKTWLVIVCGILIPVAGLMFLSAGKLSDKKAIYNFGSRVLMMGAIFIFAVVIFLVSKFLTPMPKPWLIFLFAVPLSLAVDCVMAFAAKQKSAIVTLVLYIPAIAALLYVLFGLTGILPWHPGWMVIVLSVVVDLGIIATKIMKSSK